MGWFFFVVLLGYIFLTGLTGFGMLHSPSVIPNAVRELPKGKV